MERVTLLDDLDIPARLDELRLLKPGWLEGQGVPDLAGLDWFAEEFERQFPADLPLPFVYPTEDGGLRLEWDVSDDLSIDVDLTGRTGAVHALDSVTNEEASSQLDLSATEGWQGIDQAVRERLARGGS